MSFKESVATDNKAVFMNLGEFAELHTVRYDGREYIDVPLVMRGLKESERRQLVTDHAEGLYLVSTIVHCAVEDVGGVAPEKGMKIFISDGTYMREFRVAASAVDMGMLRMELKGIDE